MINLQHWQFSSYLLSIPHNYFPENQSTQTLAKRSCRTFGNRRANKKERNKRTAVVPQQLVRRHRANRALARFGISSSRACVFGGRGFILYVC